MSQHLSSDIVALNPYRHIKLGAPNALRLSNDLDRNEVFAIRSVAMDYGFLNAVISRFVKHIYEHVKHNNYTFSDRDKLITYICAICPVDGSAIAVVAGPTPSGPLSRIGPSDAERQPIEAVGTNDPRTPNVAATISRKPTSTARHGRSKRGK